MQGVQRQNTVLNATTITKKVKNFIILHRMQFSFQKQRSKTEGKLTTRPTVIISGIYITFLVSDFQLSVTTIPNNTVYQ